MNSSYGGSNSHLYWIRAQRRTSVIERANTDKGLLLVYDNAKDTEAIAAFWPVGDRGAIAVLSRNLLIAFDTKHIILLEALTASAGRVRSSKATSTAAILSVMTSRNTWEPRAVFSWPLSISQAVLRDPSAQMSKYITTSARDFDRPHCGRWRTRYIPGDRDHTGRKTGGTCP
ncbi:hypothetical protein GGR56DRAFT_244018 [Xylariaceae sp. FL0804]|nr:hypothetical protein GGR56DRAFT_244018 [Xylariaceae sp. FL0804]